MPIRAYCTICSDFFDHSRDVAAIHCGHTFHYTCLLQWFQTAPTKTCPQCRKQVSTRHIICKLYFDIAGDEEGAVDAESLQNELDRAKALLSSKERDWRETEKVVDSLKETVNRQKRDLDNVRKEVEEKLMVCSALRKQMSYLETQQSDAQAAKEEARKLRNKMKTYERLDVLLHGTRDEVEAMIKETGVSPAAMEHLSTFCISLKKEYEHLKGSLKSSNDTCEKLRREVVASNNKLQKATVEMNHTKEDMKSLQNDLTSADKEISSLKKKVEFLQKSLSTPTRTNEALSRLIFESPAPVELKQPRLHQPADSKDIDLNLTFDIATPDDAAKRSAQFSSKKMRLDATVPSVSKHGEKSSSLNKAQNEDGLMDPFLRNSLLFRKKTLGSMLDPQRIKPGVVRTGYDGLGGRTKFIQPSPLSEIRPLMKVKRKKVVKPPVKSSACPTLDSYLE
ncbi:E3 ubiquitin-protein ligase TRAIP [Thalassophryne amazonica]|uniref:E3 ubiquitin-protein ligase TRAIP n=1 Tax=Thalassophryne amazonica TaxID=390379 RepID=UPI00147108C8|nr:E3 ubiquitin-protein ligase TRAIP [Thalassophryne amazonica]